jgi:uncharacterized protein (DUF952 family)
MAERGRPLLHITTRSAWQQAQSSGAYAAPSLETEGFIHLSEPHQVVKGPVEEFRCARCGTSAAPRATHAAHVAEPRIASAGGPRPWRPHHIARTDHSSTNPKVANARYAGVPDLVLLRIDRARLDAPVRYEIGDPGSDERFPHLYGPLAVAAVDAVLDFPETAAGFELPPGYAFE